MSNKKGKFQVDIKIKSPEEVEKESDKGDNSLINEEFEKIKGTIGAARMKILDDNIDHLSYDQFSRLCITEFYYLFHSKRLALINIVDKSYDLLGKSSTLTWKLGRAKKKIEGLRAVIVVLIGIILILLAILWKIS